MKPIAKLSALRKIRKSRRNTMQEKNIRGRFFSRFREINPEKLVERISGLTGVDKDRILALISHSPELSQDPISLSALLNLTQHIDAPIHNVESVYAEIQQPPLQRISPYSGKKEKVLINSDNKIRWGQKIGAMIGGVIALFTTIIPFWRNHEKISTSGFMGAISLTFAPILAGEIYGMVQPTLIRRTWKKQVLSTYQAVQDYGPDAYLAMTLKPWKIFSIKLRLKLLEKRGILEKVKGFTQKGEQWYAKKATYSLKLKVYDFGRTFENSEGSSSCCST